MSKFCSKECYDLYLIKVPNVTKEYLEELIWSMPFTKAGKLLNLSDVGIKKMAIRLGCTMPPSRFHTKVKSKEEKLKEYIRCCW